MQIGDAISMEYLARFLPAQWRVSREEVLSSPLSVSGNDQSSGTLAIKLISLYNVVTVL